MEVLNKNSSRKVLTDKEESQLHWEIANAYFIFNKDYEAVRESSKALVLSLGQNDSAWLTAGLASWRRGDLKRARLFFSNLANLKTAKDSVRSQGAYWASRVEFRYENSESAIKYLKIASKFPDTFYGQLSISVLGYNHNYNFETPKISKNFILWLSNQKGGQRGFALLQAKEYWHADREFRKLYPFIPDQYHLELMSFASMYGMPSLSYRLADIQRVETGKKWYGALYPELIIENKIILAISIFLELNDYEYKIGSIG